MAYSFKNLPLNVSLYLQRIQNYHHTQEKDLHPQVKSAGVKTGGLNLQVTLLFHILLASVALLFIVFYQHLSQ